MNRQRNHMRLDSSHVLQTVGRCGITFYLVLQYNVSCFIKEVIMKVSFRTENQKILEMKITQKFLPRETIEILNPGMMKWEIMVQKRKLSLEMHS